MLDPIRSLLRIIPLVAILMLAWPNCLTSPALAGQQDPGDGATGSPAPLTLGMANPTPRFEANSPDKVIADTLVICPEAFQDSLQKWVEYRTGQEHGIVVQAPGRSAFEIRQQVLNAFRTFHQLKHVVLVGDAVDLKTDAALKVPTDYVMAKVNARFGSEPEIATDNVYADIDDNGIPDVSIGRIPVDSAEELESFVDRVIRYESQAGLSDSLRRINFVAGVGGFGKLIDSAIESTTKQVITDLVPGGVDTSMTYGSWSSPYCPDPRSFSESVTQRFNEGCLFWVYIGHGSVRRLDRIRMPDQEHDILDHESVTGLDCRDGSPIAIFLACYTNAIDAREDSLAELMLKQEHGPIATIGGTRVTMPAAMGVLSLEMLHEYFHGEAPTLGELFLVAKQRMVRGSLNFRQYRQMIEGMARTLNPGNSFKRETLEHVHLLHLLGDPLLRLPRPMAVNFGGPETAQAGQQVQLSGKSPAAGELTLELAYRRDRLPGRFPRRRAFDPSDDALRVYQETYDQARDLVLCRQQVRVNEGLFSTEFQVPPEASGACVIRALLRSENGLGVGSVPVTITAAEESVDVPVAKAEKIADRVVDPKLNK